MISSQTYFSWICPTLCELDFLSPFGTFIGPHLHQQLRGFSIPTQICSLTHFDIFYSRSTNFNNIHQTLTPFIMFLDAHMMFLPRCAPGYFCSWINSILFYSLVLNDLVLPLPPPAQTSAGV